MVFRCGDRRLEAWFVQRVTMRELEYYRGREQTYIKHFFLERYLEKVAYHIGWVAKDFVYVDGFSGPWRAEHESYDDTSFMIAIQALRRVASGLAERDRRPRMRCLFIERDPKAYDELRRAVEGISDIEVRTLCGSFEEQIPKIVDFVDNKFALTFVDPTGWTGFGLRNIQPLLQGRGEVIINFMFDHINRFLGSQTGTESSFDDLFGGPGWESAVAPGPRREQRIIDFYASRLKELGNFKHVTSTRVLKPTSDRSYFYLVYGTNHPKGILEFREVERKAVSEQERVRPDAKQTARVERTGQPELFVASDTDEDVSFHEEQEQRRDEAVARLRSLLASRKSIPYEDARSQVLEIPLVWEGVFKDIVHEFADRGEAKLLNMEPRQRRVGKGVTIAATQ
ncbi:MAG: hypothetical protein CO108_11985 [Deltaproteobacteria bacterium CG_4_9_14_3_um_filter_63_12]|nr:MAG: hypothetical protein CO108_11985 [Deltaproteobacteria bacterium CG_4_9_14_3_um_filter_63_12]